MLDIFKYLNIEVIAFSTGIFLLLYSVLNISFTIINITFPKLDMSRRIMVFVLSIVFNGIGLFISHYPDKQQGNWASTDVPLVLQKLTNKIERSLDKSNVGQGSEQAVDHKGLT